MITKKLFKENINFIKAGVMLSDFYDKGISQSDMFIRRNRSEKDAMLMKTIDSINSTGLGRINFASQGIKKDWSMKRCMHSPRYTTNWEDFIVVR